MINRKPEILIFLIFSSIMDFKNPRSQKSSKNAKHIIERKVKAISNKSSKAFWNVDDAINERGGNIWIYWER